MRILGAVVLPPTALMAGANPKIMRGGSIRAQIVSDQSIWDEPAFLQEFAHRFQPGILVSLALDQHVKDLALGVDGAPQIDHAAVFPCPHFPAAARATLRADGTAPVDTAGADMGQGAWTALPQIAAESLGVHIDQVEFRSGASLLPDGGVAGGSGHTASAGLALALLAEVAAADPASPLFGAGNAGFTARDGRLHRRDDESRSQSIAEILARAGRSEVTGSAKAARHPSAAESRALYSHGAVFAEVKVDPGLGQIRVTRLVGAFAAGRIINPHLARSQYLGGMIWGLSFALQEETHCAVVLEQTPPCWKLDHKESTKLSLKYRQGRARSSSSAMLVAVGRDPTSDAKGDLFRLMQRLEPRLSFGHLRKRPRAFAGLSPCFPLAEGQGTNLWPATIRMACLC